MVTAGRITTLVEPIVAADAPEAVVLFGSYAYGTPTDDSDVDRFVVRDHGGDTNRAAIAIRMAPAVDSAFRSHWSDDRPRRYYRPTLAPRRRRV